MLVGHFDITVKHDKDRFIKKSDFFTVYEREGSHLCGQLNHYRYVTVLTFCYVD